MKKVYCAPVIDYEVLVSDTSISSGVVCTYCETPPGTVIQSVCAPNASPPREVNGDLVYSYDNVNFYICTYVGC